MYLMSRYTRVWQGFLWQFLAAGTFFYFRDAEIGWKRKTWKRWDHCQRWTELKTENSRRNPIFKFKKKFKKLFHCISLQNLIMLYLPCPFIKIIKLSIDIYFVFLATPGWRFYFFKKGRSLFFCFFFSLYLKKLWNFFIYFILGQIWLLKNWINLEYREWDMNFFYIFSDIYF